jgi:hypothetical protein
MNEQPSGNAVIQLTTLDVMQRVGEALRQFTLLVTHLQRVANPEEWGTYGDWDKVQAIGLRALSDWHAFLEYPDDERMNYGIVPTPGTRDQASLMEKLGHDFLLKNAPEMLAHRYGSVMALLASITAWEREQLTADNAGRMPGLELPPAPWLLEAERQLGLSTMESGFRAVLLPVDLLPHIDDELDASLSFMEGFEGDELQEGIDTRIAGVRAAQERLRRYMRPADLEAIVGTGKAIEEAAKAADDADAVAYGQAAAEAQQLKLNRLDLKDLEGLPTFTEENGNAQAPEA